MHRVAACAGLRGRDTESLIREVSGTGMPPLVILVHGPRRLVLLLVFLTASAALSILTIVDVPWHASALELTQPSNLISNMKSELAVESSRSLPRDPVEQRAKGGVIFARKQKGHGATQKEARSQPRGAGELHCHARQWPARAVPALVLAPRNSAL